MTSRPLDLSPEHTAFVIHREAKLAMIDLVLAAARFDTMITGCLVLGFGMSLDQGSILLENFDVSTKVLKLKKLCLHSGESRRAQRLGKLKKALERHSHARNTIAHATCAGTHKLDPSFLIFSPARAFVGRPSEMELVAIPLDVIRSDTRFYHRSAQRAARIYDFLVARRG
ncbi:MAG: hypothetical protein RDV41_14870 [Planctomycetota bacterium]|nr:hypothetical protein [Planctomycetota bacterium]